MDKKIFVITYTSVYDSDEGFETYLFTDKDEAIKSYETQVAGLKSACENDGNPPIDISNGLKTGEAPPEGAYLIECLDLSTPEKGLDLRTSVYMSGEYDQDHANIYLQEKTLNGHLGPKGLTRRKIHDEI